MAFPWLLRFGSSVILNGQVLQPEDVDASTLLDAP
jgi:hypothetical protein